MTETITTAAPPPAVRAAPMLTVLLVGQAMATMDTSITTVAAPAIRADLAASGAEQQLLLAGYTLAFAVLVVTGARLGARYGYARIFNLGLAGFTLASLCCGAAPDPVTLVLARVGQGFAGALMVPQVLSMIHEYLSGAARARAIGSYSVVLALGVTSGQVLGGALVTVDLAGLGWRAVFLVNVPVGVVLLVLSGRFLPVGSGPATGAGGRLDPVGMLLLAVGMAATVLPLVIGREAGWPGWLRLVALAAGGTGLALFAGQQRRLTARGGSPLLDLRVLTRPGVGPGLLACALLMGGYAGLVFAVVLRLQSGTGLSPLLAGIAFVPYAAGFAGCGLIAARLSGRGRKSMPVVGPLLLALAAGALAGVARDGWPWPAASCLLLLAGAGHAAGFSPLVTRISARLPGTAGAGLSALVSTGTLLGSALGVAGIGGVHLAASGPGGRDPGAGLAAAVAVLGVVLAVTAVFAWWAVRATGPDRDAAGPLTDPPGPTRRPRHRV